MSLLRGQFRLAAGLPRLFSVYGAELKKQLLWDLCGKFAAGGAVELGGTGNELRDWTDVRDVARALIRRLVWPAIRLRC